MPNNIMWLITAFCLFHITAKAGGFVFESRGNECKSTPGTYYLSELDLTEKDLVWGEPNNNVSLAATPRFQGKFTPVILTLRNQGKVPVFILIAGSNPVITFSKANDPSKRIYSRGFLISMGGGDWGNIQLDPGKMMTFMDRHPYPLEKYDPDLAPLISSIRIGLIRDQNNFEVVSKPFNIP